MWQYGREVRQYNSTAGCSSCLVWWSVLLARKRKVQAPVLLPCASACSGDIPTCRTVSAAAGGSILHNFLWYLRPLWRSHLSLPAHMCCVAGHGAVLGRAQPCDGQSQCAAQPPHARVSACSACCVSFVWPTVFVCHSCLFGATSSCSSFIPGTF